MNKDVIYIDVEDDITSIISKVKSSSKNIVAIVPPKRIGVLQSAVNLRILNRAAKSGKKRLVIVSNDKALKALAASVSIPIAKSLQSKPEIPEISALKVDDDDVIDGANLPVGEHEKVSEKEAVGSAALDGIELDDEPKDSQKSDSTLPPKKKKQKVPNFGSFRKKLFIIGGLVLLLVLFLVWAIFIAPKATVTVTAKTHGEEVNSSVTLSTTEPTDVSKGILHAVKKSTEESLSIDFEATGEKEVGDKATGTMKLTRTSIGNTTITIPAGTGFSSGKYTFISTEDAQLGETKVGHHGLQQPSTTVSVKATDIGEDYNLSSRDYEPTVSGIDATGSDMTGGSKKKITVVDQSDVHKASEELMDKQDPDSEKNKLKSMFSGDVVVIESSFDHTATDAKSTPDVGKEVKDGDKAKLETKVTYTMVGVEKSEIDKYMKAALQNRMSKDKKQKIYSTGKDGATFDNFKSTDKSITATLSAVGEMGPDINKDEIKQRTLGKKSGVVQSDLHSINGVKDVKVDLFPFWITKVPNDVDRVTIKFDIQSNG